MKRNLLVLALSFFIGNAVLAQLPNGSIAPDFTTTDINGNTHNLYEYLDDGYTVILDISATWCGPCWNYHLGGTFEEIWEDHGPSGMPGVSPNTTDDVMILWFEGDPGTSLGELTNDAGTGFGDWTSPGGTDVHFPICNDNNIASLYELPYWPIIYTICPNRVLVESGQANASTHYNNLNDCVSAVEGLNASIIAYNGDMSTGCEGNFNASVTIQNMGTETINGGIEVEAFDGSVSLGTQSYSGNLNTYQAATLDFGSVGISGSSIEFGITTADANANDNVFTQDISVAPTNTNRSVGITIITDAYGSETTWNLKNSSGQTVASGGPYNDLSAAGTTEQDTEYVELDANDCHTFTINDSYGDGINANYGEGSWVIFDGNGTDASPNILASGGTFEDSETALFETGETVAIEEDIQTTFNVYPNPASSNTNIEFSLTERSTITTSLVNVLGETVQSNVYQLNTGNQKINIDVNNMIDGIYFLHLTINGKTTTQKITITK